MRPTERHDFTETRKRKATEMTTTETKISPEEIRATLDGFSGTAEYHKLTLYGWLMATDGVAYVAESCGAYWLLDLIGSHIATKGRLQAEPFQVWKLKLLPADAENMAVVTAQADSVGNILARQLIPYTDWPLSEGIELWVEATRDANGKRLFVVLLPGEH